MNQTTAFNPPFVCKLLDGRLARFARIKMKMWAELAAEMQADRLPAVLADIEANKDLKPKERIELRSRAYDSFIPVHVAMNRALMDAKWTYRLLSMSMIEGGTAKDDVDGILDLIPTVDQSGIAEQIAMLPVVKAAKAGTEQNPLMPGVDLTGGDVSPTSSDSIDSTPANSPIEPSTNSAA